jgi:hypothetical protein
MVKNRMSRIVNGRIGKMGKPMISNLIFSYLAYPAVYDPAHPVFTNIALGIDANRFFYLLFPDRGNECNWVAPK